MIFSYYPYTNEEDVVVQPQITKYHAAYRSPMSSLRWNQWASQFLYDIAKLYQAGDEFETDFANTVSYFNQGATPSFSVQFYDTTMATPSLTMITTLSSIDDMATRLDALDKRIKVLEMRRNV